MKKDETLEYILEALNTETVRHSAIIKPIDLLKLTIKMAIELRDFDIEDECDATEVDLY